MSEIKPLEDLRALYRTAFEDWALHVSRLEQIRYSAPDVHVLDDEQSRTTAAELGYRKVRNRLADDMVGRISEGDRTLKVRARIKGLEDRSLKEFFERCEQFCASAIRRGEQPSVFFAFRRRLAAEEMTRRSAEA